MSHAGQPGVLPLRPLTVGELLDAAVSLLRVRGPLLIGLGAAAAVLEQAVLFPLRRLADVDLRYLPADDRWAWWTLLVVVGFATEAAIISALAAPATAGGSRALLGRAAPRSELGSRRAAAVAAVVAVVAAGCGLAVGTLYAWPLNLLLILLVPVTFGVWAVTYGLVGLAVPAVLVERVGPGRALLRSLQLSSRGFLRALWVRLLAYLGWFLVRVAWGMGMLQLIGLVYTSPSTFVDNVLMAAVFLVVNALAYPVLASLDAVLYLEARMRTEGMDIGLRRDLDRGVDPTRTLVGA